MNKKKLEKVLKSHAEWVKDNSKGERANLRWANLREADLSWADLREADLSGTKGLPTAKEFLAQFKHTKKGMIVYKAIGETYRPSPVYWKIAEGEFLEEVVNRVPTDNCGCGVNFATLDWIKKEFENKEIDIWECLILWEDMADVVVPYNTDGKARCARLQLVRKVQE